MLTQERHHSPVQNAYNGHRLRHVDVDGQRWYLFKDACIPLDITNYKLAFEQITNDAKLLVRVTMDSASNGTEFHRTSDESVAERRFVNEPGLYQLLLDSDAANIRGTLAWHFRRWIFKDLVPTVMRTGRYGESDDEWLARMLKDPKRLLEILTNSLTGRVVAEAQPERSGARLLRNSGEVPVRQPHHDLRPIQEGNTRGRSRA